MREKINKTLYRAVLLVSFLAVNALIIFGISSGWAFLNSGADRSAMLNTPIKSRRLYLPEVIWDTSAYEGRPMEKQSLGEIERDYLNSWYVKNLAYQTNKTYGVADYFTDSARVNIFNTIIHNKKNNIQLNNTTTAHHPELKFYSADGQLVVFNDKNVLEYSESIENDKILDRSVDTSSYRVMMLLEDGFWRVRHMVKQAAETAGIQDTVGKKAWEVVGDEIQFKDEKYKIKGINYYPQANPWDLFGEEFDPEIIEGDFKIISNAGLNTIRIFVPYEDFGKAVLKEEKLQKLKTLLNLADGNALKVMVTLFDFYGDYSVLDWTLTHEHARQLAGRFKDHPAILAWDVKNEPDLDFDSRGKELVKNWLKHIIPQIQKADPNHLITIGWANPESAEILKGEVDFVSFHYYRQPEDFPEIVQNLQKNIKKPLVLQEFGLSSYHGFWNPLGNDEEEQAAYHKKMQEVLKAQDLGFLSWTLYDYKEVPASVVGRRPWRKARQKHFGFLDTSGKPKPAFEFISK